MPGIVRRSAFGLHSRYCVSCGGIYSCVFSLLLGMLEGKRDPQALYEQHRHRYSLCTFLLIRFLSSILSLTDELWQLAQSCDITDYDCLWSASPQLVYDFIFFSYVFVNVTALCCE